MDTFQVFVVNFFIGLPIEYTGTIKEISND